MPNISGLNFQGPWPLTTGFSDVPGVYVIYTSQKWLDVGETDGLGTRVNGDNHERKQCWLNNAGGLQIDLAFLSESNQQRRLDIESNLRRALNLSCGER